MWDTSRFSSRTSNFVGTPCQLKRPKIFRLRTSLQNLCAGFRSNNWQLSAALHVRFCWLFPSIPGCCLICLCHVTFQSSLNIIGDLNDNQVLEEHNGIFIPHRQRPATRVSCCVISNFPSCGWGGLWRSHQGFCRKRSEFCSIVLIYAIEMVKATRFYIEIRCVLKMKETAYVRVHCLDACTYVFLTQKSLRCTDIIR